MNVLHELSMWERPKAKAHAPHGAMHDAVFFHPDCNRRLRHWTESADLPAKLEALAGSDLADPTAGGEFRPALKTLVLPDTPAGGV